MPSPKCALRWLAFSPVPSQTTFAFFGSTTTQHSVNDPPSSKIGVNVTPRLVVFHKPPKAVATYHVFGFLGSMAMSCTRPVEIAGPMLRSSSPLRTSAVKRSEVDAVCRAPIGTDAPIAASPTAAANIFTLRFIFDAPLSARLTRSPRRRLAPFRSGEFPRMARILLGFGQQGQPLKRYFTHAP